MNPLFTAAHMERSLNELVNLLKDKNSSFEYNLYTFMAVTGIDNAMSPQEAFRFLKYLMGHRWMIFRLNREWSVTPPPSYVYGELTFVIKREGHRGPARNPGLEPSFLRGRANQKLSFNR